MRMVRKRNGGKGRLHLLCRRGFKPPESGERSSHCPGRGDGCYNSAMPVKQATHDLQAHEPFLSRIKVILSRAFQGKECQIYLFGSRATGRHTPGSDYDLAVLNLGRGAAEVAGRELSRAREMLEESTIPFIVEIVDLNAAAADFRRRVQEQGILVWEN